MQHMATMYLLESGPDSETYRTRGDGEDERWTTKLSEAATYSLPAAHEAYDRAVNYHPELRSRGMRIVPLVVA